MIKIYYKDENDFCELFCELVKCSGEQPTESDPAGCCGCDAQEEWLNEKYYEHIIDESNDKKFISKKELFDWIDSELKYQNSQNKEFNKGYFHALNKIKRIVTAPDLNLKSSNKDSLNKGYEINQK